MMTIITKSPEETIAFAENGYVKNEQNKGD